MSAAAIMNLKRELCSGFSWLYTPVIPTGAPGKPRRFQSSLARSGGIPTVSPSPLTHQGVLTRLPVVTGRRLKERLINEGTDLSLAMPALSPRTPSKRDAAREELPVAASPGTMRRDPSTPRLRFLMQPRFPRRCGRDVSPNLLFNKDTAIEARNLGSGS